MTLNIADAVYLGNTGVDRVYLGSTLVWEPAVYFTDVEVTT